MSVGILTLQSRSEFDICDPGEWSPRTGGVATTHRAVVSRRRCVLSTGTTKIQSPPQIPRLHSIPPLLMKDRRAHRNFSGAAGSAATRMPDILGTASPGRVHPGREPLARCCIAGSRPSKSRSDKMDELGVEIARAGRCSKRRTYIEFFWPGARNSPRSFASKPRAGNPRRETMVRANPLPPEVGCSLIRTVHEQPGNIRVAVGEGVAERRRVRGI